MSRIHPRIFIPIFLMALMTAIILWPSPVDAQCGTQASSCKNCHEVQAQDPVNDKGDWHTQHAFGDFCEFCHAGNVTATDKDAAHQGMVDPMTDVKGSCQSCHASDLDERAQKYATILGVDLASASGGGSAPAETTPAASGGGSGSGGAPSADAGVVSSALADTRPVVDDPNVTDYVARYNEIVLGQQPVNVGNAILTVMLVLLVVGGGGFIIVNEKLVNVSFGDTKKVNDEYPADVVDMLPSIAGLKTKTRKSLKNVLGNSRKADKVLGLIDEVVSDEDTPQ